MTAIKEAIVNQNQSVGLSPWGGVAVLFAVGGSAVAQAYFAATLWLPAFGVTLFS